MDKVLRQFDSQADAEQAGFLDDNRFTCEERFEVFMQLMSPYYHASGGFQRVYRIDDLKSRSVRDDWGIRLQPVSEPAGDG